ncbi:MAG: tetratricopeptide repeat protein, partial [Deferribacterales bacterium]
MKRVIIAVFLSFFLIVSCSGKKDEPKVKDNITAKKPMAPIAEAQDIKIDEGNKYFLNGNFEKSIEYYSKALDENRSVAYYNIGVAYYLLGRYEESEKYFRQAIDVKNDLKDAYVNLAVTLLRQKKVGEAVEVISKIEPTNAKEYQIMAEIYTIARDYPKAYYYFKKFSKSKDPLPSGFINYGIFLKAMGDNDKGDKILNETIKKLESSEFKDYEDFYQLAVGYFALKMYDKAILNAKYAINLKKTYEALEIMVKSYEAIGKYGLAALAAES